MQAAREVARHDFKAALAAVREAARAGADAADPELAAGDYSADADVPHQGILAGLVVRDNLRFRQRIEHFYRFAIAQAKSEVVIANAYFVPGLALQRALLRAAKRGVRITLLLQGKYEYFMQHHTSRAMYGVMLDAGIEIIEYAPSFLHAKVAVFDGAQGAIATVGSSNLDPISLLLAREANVFIRDDAFSAELREHLVDAVRKVGARVEPETHMKRPFAVRSMAWVAYAMMRIALFATRHRY
jgi:cardiolipin synthase